MSLPVSFFFLPNFLSSCFSFFIFSHTYSRTSFFFSFPHSSHQALSYQGPSLEGDGGDGEGAVAGGAGGEEGAAAASSRKRQANISALSGADDMAYTEMARRRAKMERSKLEKRVRK